MIIRKLRPLIKYLWQVNLLKTLRFNFHYFPFREALRLPVLVCWHTQLSRMGGRVEIEGPVSMGMVKLGDVGLGTQDRRHAATVWHLDTGALVVKGRATIGRGSKVSLGSDGVLTLGADFKSTGSIEIICEKAITFGADCLLAWDILLMDTDFHTITDAGGRRVNPPRPITIGDHVWIGCRTTILKGVSIAPHTIVAASSVVTKSSATGHCVIGGQGQAAKVIKQDVDWHL